MRLNRRPPIVPTGNRSVGYRFAGMVCGRTFAAACLLLLIFLGCGHSDRPPLGTVHGMVTLDGKPLAGTFVAFQPVEPGRASAATTDENGKYELIYIRKDMGAKVGSHRVRISASDLGNSPVIPSRYNTQSNLKAEVKPGDNTIDFPLTSK